MILFLILGLVFGSFLNVLVHRIPRNENFLTTRSYCDNCKKTLFWYDLIPIFSFVFLKGKCRFCKVKINPQIILVEIITGLLFSATYLKFPDFSNPSLYFYLFFISSLIVILFTDSNYEIIPDKILFPLFLVGLVFFFNQNILSHILTSIGSFVIFFLIYFVSKGRAMGFGDVKFAGVLGLVLGYPIALFSFYLSFLTGGIVGFILVLWGKKKFKKDTIPFGPFLSLGAIFSIFLGDLLVSRLLSFLQ